MNDLRVGQAASVRRVFLQRDFDRFAALSGDDNPIHVDAAFSAHSKFGRTVAHGMLLYSAVCGVLGTELPGPGTLQLAQELVFPNPTCAGEEVTVRVEVTAIDEARGLVELATSVVKADGSAGLQGKTVVCMAHAQPIARPVPSLVVHTGSVSFKGLAIGQRAETRRTFSEGDLQEYAGLAGDANHVFDTGEAKEGGLPGPVIPGALLGGLFSVLLGTRLPGRGTNYLKQRLEFPAFARLGQEIAASVEIVRLRPEKQLVNLSTACTVPDGEIVCCGEALVLVSDVNG